MKEKGARSAAAIFTITIHAGLAAALIISMAWKSAVKPRSVELSAELFSQPKSSPAPVAPPEPPPPQAKTESPPPPPTASPPPAPSAADIAWKSKQEEEKKKAIALAAEKEKGEKERKARDAQTKLALQKQADRETQMRQLMNDADVTRNQSDNNARDRERARDEANKEAQRIAAARAAEADRADKAEKAAIERGNAQKAAADAASRKKSDADYAARIRNKVKGNIVYADAINGNPEAIFEVSQLPTGDVVGVSVRKSSGVRALDDAIQRAIQKSSPLPKPDNPEAFQRTIILSVKPNE